jgi:hypothetical protein
VCLRPVSSSVPSSWVLVHVAFLHMARVASLLHACLITYLQVGCVGPSSLRVRPTHRPPGHQCMERTHTGAEEMGAVPSGDTTIGGSTGAHPASTLHYSSAVADYVTTAVVGQNKPVVRLLLLASLCLSSHHVFYHSLLPPAAGAAQGAGP